MNKESFLGENIVLDAGLCV